MKSNYSVSVFMRRDRFSEKKNDAPIVVQVYRDGERTQKTVFRIKLEYWDEEKQQVRKSHPNSTEKNLQIKKAITDCEELAFNTVRANAEFGVNQIRNNIHEKTFSDFFELVDFQLEKLEKNGSISLYYKDKAIMKKFEVFLKGRKLPINKFTSGLIIKYEKYLSTEKGNCHNTIITNMKRLAKYLRAAYKKHKLNMNLFPFADYEMIPDKTKRCKLTTIELSRIMNLSYEEDDKRYDAREIFLFESLTGIRIGDILKLKWRNYRRHRLDFVTTKTNTSINLKLGDSVMEIIRIRIKRNKNKNNGELNPNDYIFNILNIDIDKASEKSIVDSVKAATALINKYLKLIAVDAKIKKNLSTHVARHSFATLLISSGVDVYTVSKLLGHTNVKTTQIYADVEQIIQDEAMDIFNNYITQ